MSLDFLIFWFIFMYLVSIVPEGPDLKPPNVNLFVDVQSKQDAKLLQNIKVYPKLLQYLLIYAEFLPFIDYYSKQFDAKWCRTAV